MSNLAVMPKRNQYRTFGEWLDASESYRQAQKGKAADYVEKLTDLVAVALNFSENSEFPEELLANQLLDEVQEDLRALYAKLLKVKA